MAQLAFQDDMLDNHCFGCGADNKDGLQIKSTWSEAGSEAICNWQPESYHMAGPTHVLNGGIIATLIDCHSICSAIAAAYREEGRGIDAEPIIWYATGSLQLSYVRPTPIDKPVLLRARITEMKGKKTIVACSLYSDDEECARGELVAIRVPPEWRNPHGH